MSKYILKRKQLYIIVFIFMLLFIFNDRFCSVKTYGKQLNTGSTYSDNISKGKARKKLYMKVPSRGAVSSYYGIRWGKKHKGIDIAAKMGSPIYAAMSGKVIYSGWINGYGNTIKLEHSGDVVTLYGHCSKLCVKKGQKVKRGDTIARVGSTGRSTGPHVHFEVQIAGKAVDPYKYLYR